MRSNLNKVGKTNLLLAGSGLAMALSSAPALGQDAPNAEPAVEQSSGGTAGVTNLTDKRYIMGGFVDLDVAGLATANYSRPREWFLKIGYEY